MNSLKHPLCIRPREHVNIQMKKALFPNNRMPTSGNFEWWNSDLAREEQVRRNIRDFVWYGV